MSDHASDTRNQILDAAADLLQRLTYPAFSYSDISAEVGIRKASIHYHFPSKEDLGLALVRRYLEEFEAFAQDLSSRQLNPAEKLDSYLEYFTRYQDMKNKICPLGSLAATSEGLPEQLKFALRNMILAHRTWLRETIRQGQDQGLITRRASEIQLTAAIGAALLGGLQLARAMSSQETLPNLLAAIRQWLSP